MCSEYDRKMLQPKFRIFRMIFKVNLGKFSIGLGGVKNIIIIIA
jgi:hypothetical protein